MTNDILAKRRELTAQIIAASIVTTDVVGAILAIAGDNAETIASTLARLDIDSLKAEVSSSFIAAIKAAEASKDA